MKRQPGQHGVSNDPDLVPDFVEGEPFLGQLQRISEHRAVPAYSNSGLCPGAPLVTEISERIVKWLMVWFRLPNIQARQRSP